MSWRYARAWELGESQRVYPLASITKKQKLASRSTKVGFGGGGPD